LPARVNQHVAIIRPVQQEIRSAFLHYLLISETYKQRLLHAGEEGGSTRQAITKAELLEFTIEFPESVTEQQRIVAILDEAFAAIAAAKANAEKNLQNARALFESHLQSVFTERGEGWVEKSVAQLVEEGVLAKPFDGNHGEIHPKKADYTLSGVPFIMACDLVSGGVDTKRCTFISRRQADSLRVGFAKDGDVLISHKGTIGRSAILETEDDYIMLTPQVTSYRVKDRTRLSNRFVHYYFMSPVFQREMIAGAADGSTRAYIGITKQLGLRLRFPHLAEQERIVARLGVLDPETQRLAAIYTRKLAALEELKKSLLHQAFSGQLTANFRETVSIPFPDEIPGISITDLHAGILAMAHRAHERGKKPNLLTKVKVEKISHMIEAWAGIELGRKPVKDCFGPNDTKHLKGVEHRAKMTKCFSFQKDSDGGERIRKLENFEALLAKTETALGERRQAVEDLLALMLPMDLHQAEIFATVHAAWNNLLLTGQEATDEAIVTEARENWHPEKLKIERDKFFRAIAWIREKGLVPEGRGKLVEAKLK
jgi:type I restriction enzyme S subunit